MLAKETPYIGSLKAPHIRVAEVFQEPIRRSVAAIIVSNNHPSGEPSPSPEDVQMTRQLRKAGALLNVDLLDPGLLDDRFLRYPIHPAVQW